MAWVQLLNMVKQNRAQRERDMMTPPITCPVDGTPLFVKPDGTRHCPLGNFIYRG